MVTWKKHVPVKPESRTYDMKFAVPVFFNVLNRLKAGKEKILLAFTFDEEIGGNKGVRYLLDEVGLRPAVGFIPDGGDNFQIEAEEKGVFLFDFVKQVIDRKDNSDQKQKLGRLMSTMKPLPDLEQSQEALQEIEKKYDEGTRIAQTRQALEKNESIAQSKESWPRGPGFQC